MRREFSGNYFTECTHAFNVAEKEYHHCMASKIVLYGGFALALYVLYIGVRSAYFLSKTKNLATIATTFPTEYTVGQGTATRTYVILGDSTAVGVGLTSLEQTLGYTLAAQAKEPVHVHNYAVIGATMDDVVTDQLPQLQEHIDTAVISISANDATHFTSETSFSNNLTTLLDALVQRNVSHILVTTTPNFSHTPALPSFFRYFVAKKAAKFSALISEGASKYASVRVVDLHTKGILERNEYAADSFHPSEDGYKKWSNVFSEAQRQ
jgi:lysophospholipase L1-like esterase